MLLLVLLGVASQRPSSERPSSELLRGAGFAGGPMATPHAPLGGAAANTSMRALAATGAAHVQLYSTWTCQRRCERITKIPQLWMIIVILGYLFLSSVYLFYSFGVDWSRCSRRWL